jgi:hypothetical protein
MLYGLPQTPVGMFDDLFTLQEVGAAQSEGNASAQLLEFQR